jgi:hypothetical protein
MRHAHRLTLITSGPTRLNLFARFPKLAPLLGSIRATSSRTATRAAALFRGGWAAESWEEVLNSPLIVIQNAAPQQYAEMLALGKSVWRDRAVLACDSEADLRHLAALEALGAGVAHLHLLDPREPLVALSGENTAVSKARRTFMTAGVRSFTIRDGAGPTLLAAIDHLEKQIAEALQEGDRAFQHAGLRRAEARVVAVGAAVRALRP